MEDENRNEEETAVENAEPDYISTIKELKENTVSKEKFQKLQEENKRLLNAYANGQKLEGVDVEKETIDVEQLKRDLFLKDNTNLEFVEKALKLREIQIEQTGKDPFLPWGRNVTPSEDDYRSAEKVATVLQECVDVANGDTNIFTNELQRRTVDSMPFNVNKFKRR